MRGQATHEAGAAWLANRLPRVAVLWLIRTQVAARGPQLAVPGHLPRSPWGLRVEKQGSLRSAASGSTRRAGRGSPGFPATACGEPAPPGARSRTRAMSCPSWYLLKGWVGAAACLPRKAGKPSSRGGSAQNDFWAKFPTLQCPPPEPSVGGRMGLITSAGGEISDSQTGEPCPGDAPAPLGLLITRSPVWPRTLCNALILCVSFALPVGHGVGRNGNATQQGVEVPPATNPRSVSHRL